MGLGTDVGSGPGTKENQKISKWAGRTCTKSGTGRKTATGRNTKHIGDLAELDFMLQAAGHGFAIAKPFGDSEHYDIMVDAGGHIWRVQVKTANLYRNRTFAVRSHWSGYSHLVPYTPADIDFLAAFIRRYRIWSLIPARAIKNRFTLNLYPFGARRSAAHFEKYREAWHLLRVRGAAP
jgi:hypothetical protein